VCCEKCGAAYYYDLARVGVGKTLGIYGIDAQKQQITANENSRRSVLDHLEHDVEPVACPKCGWLQAEMILELRRRIGRRLLIGAIACIAAMVVMVFI